MEINKQTRAHTPVGDAIRSIRERRGMTVEALARKVGLNKSTISKIENNLQNCTTARLDVIAHALGVTTVDVLSEIPADQPRDPFARLNEAAEAQRLAEIPEEEARAHWEAEREAQLAAREAADAASAPPPDPVVKAIVDELARMMNAPADQQTSDMAAQREHLVKTLIFYQQDRVVAAWASNLLGGLNRAPVSDERVEQFIPPAPKVKP